MLRRVLIRGEELELECAEHDAHPVPGAELSDSVIDGVLPYVAEDATCIDIGANLGVWSIAISRRARAGRLVALEPVPNTFSFLEKNLARHVPNATALPVACGAAETTIPMSFTDYFSAGSHIAAEGSIASAEVTEATTVPIDVLPLDLVVAQQSLERVDVVKVDTEGFESEVLAGAAETFRRFRPVVQLEFNHFALGTFRKLLAQDVLQLVRDTFPYVYVHARQGSALARIVSAEDAYRFLWANANWGPVDNLLCAFEEVAPEAPTFADGWEDIISPPTDGGSPSRIRDLEAANAALEQAVADARQQVQDLKATRSWQVTAPMRAFSTWMQSRSARS